jgi:hypothetical protein
MALVTAEKAALNHRCWQTCLLQFGLHVTSQQKNVLQQVTASYLALKPPLKTWSELWPVRSNESMQKRWPWRWRELEKIIFERWCVRLIFCWVYICVCMYMYIFYVYSIYHTINAYIPDVGTTNYTANVIIYTFKPNALTNNVCTTFSNDSSLTISSSQRHNT